MAPPLSSCPYSPNVVEGEFSEVEAVASRNRLILILATPDATSTLPGWGNAAVPRPDALSPYPGGGACYRELPRIPLFPRTSVNKGIEKGRSYDARPF